MSLYIFVPLSEVLKYLLSIPLHDAVVQKFASEIAESVINCTYFFIVTGYIIVSKTFDNLERCLCLLLLDIWVWGSLKQSLYSRPTVYCIQSFSTFTNLLSLMK